MHHSGRLLPRTEQHSTRPTAAGHGEKVLTLRGAGSQHTRGCPHCLRRILP